MRDVLLYSVLRLAIFGAIWWLLIRLGMGFTIAGLVAALIALLVSILVLRHPRQAAAERWRSADQQRREKRHARGGDIDQDAADEDDLLDAAGGEPTPGPASRLPEDPPEEGPTR